ncbi:hypothetical protein Tco_1511412 [Tanacetum coccineum]
MQISAFMSNSKYPELARRFSDQVPKTLTEMMRRVDDYIKSKKAYKSTELPRESSQKGDKEHHTVEAGHLVRHTEGDIKGWTIIITSTPGCPNQAARGDISNRALVAASTMPSNGRNTQEGKPG